MHYSTQQTTDPDTGAPLWIVWSGPVQGLPLDIVAVCESEEDARRIANHAKRNTTKRRS